MGYDMASQCLQLTLSYRSRQVSFQAIEARNTILRRKCDAEISVSGLRLIGKRQPSDWRVEIGGEIDGIIGCPAGPGKGELAAGDRRGNDGRL